MSKNLEKGSVEEKAAAIARDITVAVASTLDKPPIENPETAQKYGEGLVHIYAMVFAAARNLLTKEVLDKFRPDRN